MSKLLQYLVNKPSVQHKVLPGLRKMQMAGQYNAERDATFVNTPVLSKMFGAQREVDVNQLNQDAFKEKYNMTPYQYKMKTDSDYAQAFQRQMDDRRQNDPNYSELNLPATDVRSKLYRGNPNLALIPKGATGQARAQQEQLFADMTSLSAPLLPVKSLVKGLQVGKAASAAPKIIDKLISTPSPVKTAATESADNSGLLINDEVYRQWANARRKANIPESRSAIRSSTPPLPSPQSTQAWGTGNWDGSTIIPADNIQPYRPVWSGTQLRNTTISPLDLSSFVEGRADRLIGATRKIDEKLGQLLSKKTNPPVFNADEVIRLINENLSKGVGVKKENLGLQVRNSPLPYDLETGFRIETLIDNNKVGSILFQRNMTPYRPKKLSQILLDKLPTPFERWQNTPGFKKTNDFPFQDYDPFKPVKDPTGKTFNTANDLYRTGISGEFNKAVNEALKAKGLGNVLSGGTGHSALGQARWEKLVEKGLAEDLGDGYYKLKKQGGPVVDPRGQWAHPGKRTIVPTPTGRITMQGVPYPVYGQDETGFGQMMYPGGEYKFPGQMVDEMPIAQWGKQVPFKEAATPTKNTSNPLNLRKELVPYIRPKASFEEQKRIAKLELDKYGYTLDQRKNYIKGKSEKAFKNIVPQGYGDLTRTLDRIERYEKNLGRNPEETLWYGAEDSSTGKPIYYDLPKRDDAFALYLGLPQKNKSFGISEYQPGDSKENKYYYKPNYLDENLKNRLVASYFSNVEDGKNTYIANERGDAFPQKTDSLERAGVPFENPMYAEWMVDNALGDFKMSKGKDKKGHYISIYDEWDLNPFKQGEGSSSNPAAAALKVFAKMKGVDVGDETEMSNLFGAGKPFEIYDRIYYDPKTKKVIPQKRNGGGILSKSVTCSNCGHSWKAVEGGIDPLNCHKCGGLVKMQRGGQHKRIPFEQWYQTIPASKKDTTTYNLRKAYQLAPQSQLDAFVQDANAHLYTVYPNAQGVYEFMKSKNHPTIGMELDWFNSNDPEAVQFRKKYNIDQSGDYYRYVPKKGSGGQHGGLDRWFAEKWVDVKTGKDCGRQEGESRAGYPACRPSKRVSSETPKTSSEMSSAEKAKFKANKTSSQRINYNHKRNK